MKAGLCYAGLTFGLTLLRADGTHFGFEVLKRVADNALAARKRNIAACRNGKHAAAYRAETRSTIGSPPAHDGGNQHRQ